MSTVDKPVYEWQDLPWKIIEKRVFKLQKRIYQASKRGDTKTVHKLQRLLAKSWSARCLAVRRVSQDNRGKKTAGVDGVKALPPTARLDLVENLSLNQKAQPTRRVWIPKPGTEEKRPLAIPTMENRAGQALAKLMLEPEWESRFEANSYGFRPGRSAHDAIEAIFNAMRGKAKYVLDADIAKCFERINQTALLTKLNTYPGLRRTLKAWLKAGVLDGAELFPTEEGCPQGGVVSPLLMNVALHGLETAIASAFPQKRKGEHWQPIVIRFADDFVVLHPELAVIEQVKQMVSDWLAGMGLELKPSKTRISHTLHSYEGTTGFTFLGFEVRQYAVGKTHSGRTGGKGRPSKLIGFKTIIKPSKPSIQRHYTQVQEMIGRHKIAKAETLIKRLNPVIRGWCNYYSTVVAKRSFARLDCLTFLRLKRWAKRRHPNKPWKWVVRKYWRLETGKWDFALSEGLKLLRHSQTPIKRHIKIAGAKSPFDGDLVYWASRLGRHPQLRQQVAKLLKRQAGKCARCGLYFREEDLLETDHILPVAVGGEDKNSNKQLLHGHCHDQKTAKDGSYHKRGTGDKSQVGEELGDGKPSRPVLKTSQVGDCLA